METTLLLNERTLLSTHTSFAVFHSTFLSSYISNSLLRFPRILGVVFENVFVVKVLTELDFFFLISSSKCIQSWREGDGHATNIVKRFLSIRFVQIFKQMVP